MRVIEFKARFGVWFFRVYIPLTLAAYIIFLGGINLDIEWLIVIFGIMMIGWIIYSNVLPLKKLIMIIDNHGITLRHMRINFLLPIFEDDYDAKAEYFDQNLPKYVIGNSIRFDFRGIEAIWLGTDRVRKPSLYLATDSFTMAIPTRWLNTHDVWQTIKDFAPERLLQEQARKNATVRRAWTAHNHEFLDNLEKDFSIKLKKGILIVGYLVMFALGSILCIAISERFIWGVIFFGLPVLGVIKFILAYPKHFYMNKEGLRITTYFREFEIRWDEILKFSSDGSFLTFHAGENKYVIPSAHNWISEDKEEAISLIKAQISVQDYEIEKIVTSNKQPD